MIGRAADVFLLLFVLGRFRNGALLRPVIARLSRIGFMRPLFTRVSTAAIERQNPDLASALKKLGSVQQNPNPQAVQKAMSRLTPAERRALPESRRLEEDLERIRLAARKHKIQWLGNGPPGATPQQEIDQGRRMGPAGNEERVQADRLYTKRRMPY